MYFSILVPVYNTEKYLKQCLDSILGQTIQDFELIIVNDGSTDNSGAICDYYQSRYPQKISVFHNKNQGLLLTRREAIRRASGDYILFVDSDDYVAANLLEKVKKTIEETNSDLIMYNFVRFFEDGTITDSYIPLKGGEVYDRKNKRDLYRLLILEHKICNMWIKAVKREIVDINEDYTKWPVKRGEDVIQTFPLIGNAKKIKYINDKLYFYRKGDQSITSEVRPNDYKSFLLWYDRSLEYIELWDMKEEIQTEYITKQIVFFFGFLRAVCELANRKKDMKIFFNTLEGLAIDERFIHIRSNYNINYVPKKLQFRIRLFEKYLKHSNWKKIYILIASTNQIAQIFKKIRSNQEGLLGEKVKWKNVN